MVLFLVVLATPVSIGLEMVISVAAAFWDAMLVNEFLFDVFSSKVWLLSCRRRIEWNLFSPLILVEPSSEGHFSGILELLHDVLVD